MYSHIVLMIIMNLPIIGMIVMDLPMIRMILMGLPLGGSASDGFTINHSCKSPMVGMNRMIVINYRWLV